jgi:hypothetical protein
MLSCPQRPVSDICRWKDAGRSRQSREEADSIGKEQTVSERTRQRRKEKTDEKRRKGADRGGKKQTVSERSIQWREKVDRCGMEQTNGKVGEGADSDGKKQTDAERSRQMERCEKEQTKAGRSSNRKDRGAKASRNRLGILEKPGADKSEQIMVRAESRWLVSIEAEMSEQGL